MKLENIIIPTGVARTGMQVGEVFRECVRSQVPRLPFVDDSGTVTGYVSIRKTIQQVWIPDFVVTYADLLGDNLEHLSVPENHARQVLQLPVDRFVRPDFTAIDSASPVVKAVALMEKHDTNHVFIIDNNHYKGIVTVDGLARRMLEVGYD